MVELDVGREGAGVAADDGEGEREAVARGAHDGLGAPPTPTQVRSGGCSTGGWMRTPSSGERTVPFQWTGSPVEGVRIHPPVEHPPGDLGRRRRQPRVRRARRALPLPLALAIIGGDPRRFAPYVKLYHRALRQLG